MDQQQRRRQVYLDTSPSSCGGAIDAGTTLLRIPDACLPSLHSVERDEEFGKSLFGVVHSLEASLYHDAQDVVVALFLARQQQQQQQSPSFYEPYIATLPVSSNTSLTNDGVNSSVCNNNIKLLPRQWDSETLKRRLYGTLLYKRIINEQNGIKCEYELIKTAWMRQQKEQQQSSPTTKDDQKQTSQSSLFPTCEQYDNMMSLVTSRGFDGLGYDGVDVMIPLLDLLNHVRGHGVDNTANGDGSGGVAHVRYERYHEEDETNEDGSGDGEPATKRIKTDIDDSTTATNNIRSNNSGGGERGGVKVTAGQSIVANGTKLQMTYGAKSNSTLLGRYGFCIADNVEPDGSCNDVVEIELKEEAPPVKLQRGPKSYTYGPFIKALKVFYDAGNDARRDDDDNYTSNKHLQDESVNDDANDRGEEDDNDDGGLQAFLDDCGEDDYEDDDDDEEGGDDLDDMMYNPTSFGDDEQLLDKALLSSTKAEGKMNDLRALEALHSSLKQAMDRCERNSLIRSSGGKERSYTTAEDLYCIMLIKSEMQTISFYKRAAEMVHSKLSKSSPGVASLVDGKFEMTAMDLEHINDLVGAFLTIRYPGVSI
eukprot:scaffold37618_cov241-Skeletonema_marinoi.AAC.1